MKTRLFISLSVVALFGLSATAYGTLYINGKDKNGNLPKGDCWEMKCPNGCVEEEGTFTGHCCPGGDSCRINGKDIAECCGEGKTCKNGKCESNCPAGSKPSETKPGICCSSNYVYDGKSFSVDAMACGCPAGSKVSETEPEICCLSNKYAYDHRGSSINAAACGCPVPSRASETKPDVCCLNNYVYDGRRNNSVDAMACGCPGGRQKYTEEGEEKCCPENYQLPKHGESCNTSCGCFNNTVTGLVCSSETNTCVCPDTVWDPLNNKCCAPEKRYTENGQEKCCSEGILNPQKTVCTPFPDEEFVCKDKSSVGKDGSKFYICCKTNDYPVDYYYSVTGSGSLGGWFVQIRDKATTSTAYKDILRQDCIFQKLEDGRCKTRSKNYSIKPDNFNTRVHPGEKACMYIYSNGGGSANYEVWFKRAR